jgi:hypothetical protein
LEYIEIEETRTTKADHYFAQICEVLVKTQLSKNDAKKVKREHYLLKFVRRGEKSSQMDPETRTAWSKAFWCSKLGMVPENN